MATRIYRNECGVAANVIEFDLKIKYGHAPGHQLLRAVSSRIRRGVIVALLRR